ncbi:MAG: DUF4382 domain-containing protein [Desulfomonilia bacterium]
MKRQGKSMSEKGVLGELWKRVSIGVLIGVYACIILGSTGCSSDSSHDFGTGDLFISLTDDEGDFLHYSVDVQSLELTKAGGAEVFTLPLSTRVDFSQYTDLTEFLTAATVPSGVYTSATLILDYTDAEIWVENDSGEAVEIGGILDEEKAVVTTLEVSVVLEGRNSLTVLPGVPASLILDFDLAVSNTVEFFEEDPPVLTVSPVLQASVDVDIPDIHRLRGALKSVDTQEGAFEVIIHPFIHIISGGDERFGVIEILTQESTSYDINGELFEGDDGLSALADQVQFTAVIVYGELNIEARKFVADEVLAGTSVPGGGNDVVNGTVVACSGDMLTLKGATLIRSQGSLVFHDTISILVGQGTSVTKQLSPGDYSTEDISVGQRMLVFGTLTSDSPGSLELDASHGHIRMMLTTLRGVVVNISSGTVVLDLNSIDGRRIGLYDFSGTGQTPETDADPEHYEINTSSIALSSLEAGIPLKVRGFVVPFGQAPHDFDAKTLVDVSDVPAMLHVNWYPASSTAIEDLTSEGFELTLDDVGVFHHVARAGILVDLLDIPVTPFIIPSTAPGIYTITQGATVLVHTSFDVFAEDLEERISTGGSVRGLVASGLFDDDESTMMSSYLSIRIQ